MQVRDFNVMAFKRRIRQTDGALKIAIRDDFKYGKTGMLVMGGTKSAIVGHPLLVREPPGRGGLVTFLGVSRSLVYVGRSEHMTASKYP